MRLKTVARDWEGTGNLAASQKTGSRPLPASCTRSVRPSPSTKSISRINTQHNSGGTGMFVGEYLDTS